MGAVFGVAIVGLLLLVWAISVVNRFARLENLVRESWADVDVALKRRHDLIPNLVATVRGYTAHESDVLQRVVDARSRALQGTASDETELARATSVLLARTEAYPQLRSSANFLDLQHELVNTEDRIAAARRFYNANIRDYNILLESFPAGLIKGARTTKQPYVVETITERAPIAVSLP